MVMPRMPRVGGGVRVPRVRTPTPRVGTGLGGVGRMGDKSKAADKKADKKDEPKGRMGDKSKARKK